jgi:hypothetical protein
MPPEGILDTYCGLKCYACESREKIIVVVALEQKETHFTANVKLRIV